jgi:hypothetical protein
LLGFRESSGTAVSRAGARGSQGKGCAAVKKLFLLALVAIGILAVWRKVQADRAELDLWTEATTDED